MKKISVSPAFSSKLDPGFVPAALWNREYRKMAESAGAVKAAVCLERAGGAIARFNTIIAPETPEYNALNLRYLERIVKFMLWAYGGWKVTVAGAPVCMAELKKIYAPDGPRAFDFDVMGRRIYDAPFTIESIASYDDAPAAKDVEQELGGHFSGCRIGFDLGGSDRKCAAVIDGKSVHSEEVVWDPYFQSDIEYHRDGILDSLRRAAAKLPRVDAIGGSAAGVYVDNQPRIASLFRGIPEEDFASKVRPIFLEIAKEFPGVPFVVLNDGEVTALAGAVSMGKNALIGLAMGTSEAVGYVTPAGKLTTYLNELAFAPVDYREDEPPVDEWSGDAGVGASYLSQQAVGRLVAAAGFDLPAEMPLPERLKEVQKAMAEDDPRAAEIYRTIGIYLGYALAHYSDFYEMSNLLLLGRVSSGKGGDIIIENATAVLKQEFPELDIALHVPDETFKRHGQAVIAATL